MNLIRAVNVALILGLLVNPLGAVAQSPGEEVPAPLYCNAVTPPPSNDVCTLIERIIGTYCVSPAVHHQTDCKKCKKVMGECFPDPYPPQLSNQKPDPLAVD